MLTVAGPIRQHYLRVKAAYPEHIVLYRLGDFYEAFDDDGETLARALGVMLVTREVGADLPRVRMAGVIAGQLERDLGRLVAQGYRVAVAEPLPGQNEWVGEHVVTRETPALT